MSYHNEVKTKNKSTLSYPECAMMLQDFSVDFDKLSMDDLDAIYRVAFGHWAYHMSRTGYVMALTDVRHKLFVENCRLEILKKEGEKII